MEQWFETAESENEDNATKAIVIAFVVFICAVMLAIGLGYLVFELAKQWLC